MHECLKLFVLMDRKHFANKASEYLESKGLSIDVWAEGIHDCRKGDVLVLFGLKLLLVTHTVVHVVHMASCGQL